MMRLAYQVPAAPVPLRLSAQGLAARTRASANAEDGTNAAGSQPHVRAAVFVSAAGAMAAVKAKKGSSLKKGSSVKRQSHRAARQVPFVNLSIKRTFSVIRDVCRAVGLDGIWLTLVNVLLTLGVAGEQFDGIPVQNKWMTIVAENVESYGKTDAKEGQQQMQSLIQNAVMGRMERITGAPMPVFLEGYGESCGIYKIVIGPRSVVVVSDPVILKRILTSSQENYTKGILSEVLEPIMGKGLIPADPVTWRSRRKALVPGFHKQWLESTVSLMVDCAEALCGELDRSIKSVEERRVTVNMEEKFTSASLDIIGKAIFDYDFGSVERESPIIRAVFSVLREAERRAQSVIPYWNLPGASRVFRDQKSHEENLTLLNAVLDELIRTAMLDPADENKHISLLRYLVMTKNEEVTNRQLRDDLMTLLIAGHETTAALLTWTLHELMKPEHSKHLRSVTNEIDSVLDGRRPTFEDLKNLPFMRACLIETLRLYPEPPLLIRRCVNGDEVPVGPTCSGMGDTDTVTFLPGQDIFISTWSLHRSTLLWGEDAAVFDPTRWQRPCPAVGRWAGYSPEKVQSSGYPNELASDFAFVPFGGGPRKCLGDQFALLEAEVCLVALFQRFNFEADPSAIKDGVGMITGATIHTMGGLLADVRLRTDIHPSLRGASYVDAGPPRMQAICKLSVQQRIEPEAMVVPTARELRELFTAQKEVASDLDLEPSTSDAVEEAYEKCRAVTEEFSKTFYLGSQFLAPAEQRVVWAIYNWCRDTDELIDGPNAASTTMADLQVWEDRLDRTFKLKDPFELSTNWADLALADGVRRFSLIQRPFQDMIGGMAMDLVKERYATFQELEVYCYRVAGTVGVMTLPVLGFDSLQNFTEELQEQTLAAAMALGMAFQLTNILRDVGEDARRNRIYLPREDLDRFGITEEEVLAASDGKGTLLGSPKWAEFMEFQIQRCEAYYKEAEDGIVGLSEVSRLGVMAARFVYGQILDEIRKNSYDNFSQRAYVSLYDKFFLMGRAWLKCRELQEVAEQNVRSGRIFVREKEKEKVKT